MAQYLKLISRKNDNVILTKKKSILGIRNDCISNVDFQEREIYDVFYEDGRVYTINKLTYLLMMFFPMLFVTRKNRFMVFPYGRGHKKLSISILPDNGKKFHHYLMEYFAYSAGRFLKCFWENPILIFEKYANYAEDSAYLVYKKFREVHPDIPVYYVMKRDSRDIGKFKDDDHIILFGTMKHFIFLVACKMFVSTEGKGHSYFWGDRNGLIPRTIKLKPFIFLQHGVIGFKKIDYIFNAKSVYGPDLFVASSDFEKQIIDQELGYGESHNKKVIVTGLPRFDKIITDKSKQKYTTFFYTWRPWLESKTIEEQLNSDYAKHIRNIAQRAQKDSSIKIILHPKMISLMRSEVDAFPSVFINTDETSIKSVFDQTKLLVTDYSSVAWEAYYRNIPVIFDMFDQNMYESIVGSYLDLNHVPFGLKLDVLNNWQTVVNYNYVLSEKDAQQKHMYFKYSDKDNTDRCVAHILNYYRDN
ncbi:CDP-glycerol glycerophosphotransferase family protein [Weissella ceti]|uniref:CDP-glycerol glycerophosphotransferase family protein n=1 Tax=Weissella ceti TaxID=759620 RepID=A0ABT3E3F2_9LACO|nr:CDP-glycerol glycerophosphotransferase family protein [Weissella ceti]MCW0952939.1 CDP-glycerol glycerophosphotransferase family protein [Weissella ceti]QVK11485.1 CDP-glycerol glycerophosphotransferase family protein [Weissella ceti]